MRWCKQREFPEIRSNHRIYIRNACQIQNKLLFMFQVFSNHQTYWMCGWKWFEVLMNVDIVEFYREMELATFIFNFMFSFQLDSLHSGKAVKGFRHIWIIEVKYNKVLWISQRTSRILKRFRNYCAPNVLEIPSFDEIGIGSSNFIAVLSENLFRTIGICIPWIRIHLYVRMMLIISVN